MHFVAGVFCRERSIDRTTTPLARHYSVGGFTRCASVDQGEYRYFCDPCGRPVAELPCKRESFLQELWRLLCSRKPVSAVCADEASVGRHSGTCLLRSGDRVC